MGGVLYLKKFTMQKAHLIASNSPYTLEFSSPSSIVQIIFLDNINYFKIHDDDEIKNIFKKLLK